MSRQGDTHSGAGLRGQREFCAHRIPDWFRVEGTSKMIGFQPAAMARDIFDVLGCAETSVLGRPCCWYLSPSSSSRSSLLSFTHVPAQIFPGRVKAAVSPAEKQPRVFSRELPHRSSLQLGAATEIFQGEKARRRKSGPGSPALQWDGGSVGRVKDSRGGYDRLMCFPGNQDKPKLIIKGMSRL